MKKVFILGNKEKFINYYNALKAVGAQVIFGKSLDEAVECDALLLTGGDDVNPKLYGEENTDSQGIDDGLDKSEFELIKHFYEKSKAILGICRGAQILNVYFGGSLIQHLGESEKHSRMGENFDKVHRVELLKDCFLKDLYGKEFYTNSAHHQAVKRPAKCFDVLAVSGEVTEFLLHKNGKILAVQWHPERMCLEHRRDDTVDGIKLFEHFFSII